MFKFLKSLFSKKDRVVFTYKRLSKLLKDLRKVKRENIASYKISKIEYIDNGLLCTFNTNLGCRYFSICLENHEIVIKYSNTSRCIFKMLINKKTYQKLFSTLTLHEMDLAIYEIEEIVKNAIKIY